MHYGSRRQRGGRLVIGLAAGDDMHVLALIGQVKREIAQQLARRRVVRKEVAIKKDDAGSQELTSE